MGTLIYLAFQTRDQAKILSARAVWDAHISYVEVNEILGDGGPVSELIFSCLSDPEALSNHEKYLLHRFTRGWFQRLEAQFTLYNVGILDAEVWQLRRGYAKAMLENALLGEARAIDKNNSMFTKTFIEEIDSTLQPELSGFMGIRPNKPE
ncbi:MAG TPA: hypothetical protein EYQ14_20175 [Gammaproteobacteria bacterium]|nr:hypothetical protein [Gammaproteobacteria bacterium]HIL99162.1 hypothetical protein [Pseudomonadales bacterium]